jgi:hypothetical protein
MTGIHERGAPDIGSHVDESSDVPSPKAYRPPFTVDRLRGRLTVRRNRMTFEGEAEVGHGIHEVVSFAIVSAVAVGTGVVAAVLCVSQHAGGLATGATAGGAFALVLTIGLIRTSSRSRRD